MVNLRAGLRVLQVIYQDPVTYPPTLNAARVLSAAGARVQCLGYRRVDVGTLSLPASAEIVYQDVAFTSRLPSPLRKVADLLQFRRETRARIKAFDPDLVIAYDHWGAWAVLPYIRRKRFKVVLHLLDLIDRSVGRFASSHGWMWAEMVSAIDRFDLLVFPDQTRAAYFRDAWPRGSVPAIIAANSPARQARPGRDDALRKIIGTRPGDFVAVVIGNMGLHGEAVRALSQARGRWHLAIIGAGHEPTTRAVTAEAAELGLADRIHVIPYTNYDLLKSWLPGCDVGLSLYPAAWPNVNWQLVGGASVKVQEYMAAGLPSIVCSRKAFETLAAETGALSLLEAETAQAIAAALDAVEPGTEMHARLSSAATRAHEGRYNCEAQLQPVLNQLGLGLASADTHGG